jgi:hypothetical protein
LALDDPGFDFSVLSAFRTRLVEGAADYRLLEVLLQRCQERGYRKARGRQRTDSTHVLGAVRVLDRVERVAETLRAALNALAQEAPDWLRAQVAPDWYERYSRRIEEYHLPKGQDARHAYAAQIGTDGAVPAYLSCGAGHTPGIVPVTCRRGLASGVGAAVCRCRRWTGADARPKSAAPCDGDR